MFLILMAENDVMVLHSWYMRRRMHLRGLHNTSGTFAVRNLCFVLRYVAYHAIAFMITKHTPIIGISLHKALVIHKEHDLIL